MFSLIFHRGLPKCKECIYYIPSLNKKVKKYDMGKCKKFENIYTELARMDDLKCSIFGFKFEKKY